MMQESASRIIDANFNRAREALRVLEDYTRFVRNDGPASYQLRQMRHDLSKAIAQLGPAELLAARDVIGDIGATQPSPSDRLKTDPLAVATAAAKRLPEALRTIEEYCKTTEAHVSDVACKLRYKSYDLEKRIFAQSNPQAKWKEIKLYLLLTSDLCGDDPVTLAGDLLAAGVDCIQLREKNMPDKQLLPLARQLCQACHAKSAMFIVNDRPDIAALVGADGVHLGQDDLPIDQARRILDGPSIVGTSTHNPQQVRQALDQCADYVAIGPAFATATKPHEPAAGLEFVAAAVKMLQEANVPHLAIGGITLENLPELICLGVRQAAVCSAILSAHDPPAVARQFADILDQAAEQARRQD